MNEDELKKLHEAISSKFDIGNFDSFKSKMLSIEDRKHFFDVVNSKGYSLGDYSEYEKRIAGQVQPETPAAPVEKPIIDQALEADRLSKLGEATNAGNIDMFTPDEKAVQQAKDIKSGLIAKGINPDKIVNNFSTLTYTPEKKAYYDELAKTNPQQLNRLLSHDAYKMPAISNFNKQLADAQANNDVQEVSRLKNDMLAIDRVALPGNYSDVRARVRTAVQGVRGLSDDPDGAVKLFGEEAALVYGKNMLPSTRDGVWYKPDGDKNLSDETVYQAGLNTYHKAALDFLQDTDYKGYEAYKGILTPLKSRNPKNIDQRIGYQEHEKRLEELGIKLKYDAAMESYNEAKTAGDKGAMAVFAKTVDETIADSKTIDNRYPLLKIMDAQQKAMDIDGRSDNAVQRFGKVMGNSVDNTVNSVWDVVSAPFRSEEGYQNHLMEVLGDSKVGNLETYLPVESRTTVDSKIDMTPGAKNDIDRIKNSDLSDAEKNSQIADYVMQHPDKVKRRAIEPETNISLKSILYGVTDLGASIAPYVALSAATGGGASATALRSFSSEFSSAALTMYHDELASAIDRGDENPYAAAFRRTAVMSLAMAGAGTAGKIRELAMGSKNPALKAMIAGMDDKAIEKSIADAGKSKAAQLFGEVKDKVIASAKSSAQITPAISAGNIANKLIDNEPVSVEGEVKNMMVEGLKFFVFGTATGVGGMLKGRPDDISKLSIYEAAKDPEKFNTEIDAQLESGKITPEQHAQVKSNIDLAKKVMDKTSLIDNRGKPLNDKKARDLLFLKFQEAKANELLSKDIPETVQNKVTKLLEGITEEIKQLQITRKEPETDTKLSEPIDGLDDQGIPQGDNVPPPVEVNDKPAEATTPTADNPVLKDVKSTTKALSEFDDKTQGKDGWGKEYAEIIKLTPEYNKKENAFRQSSEIVADAYHKAKVNGSNPRLVKAVEKALGISPEITATTPTVSGEEKPKEATTLLKEARDNGKLGVFKDMPDEAALKMISQQAQDLDSKGIPPTDKANAEMAMKSTVKAFGQDLVDAAIKKYPAESLIEKGITVYHGSPHNFTGFNLSKVGTGQGAQSFGHGLYFTNSEDIANKLSSKKNFWEALRNGNELSMSKQDFDFINHELDALGFDGSTAENENIGAINVDGKSVHAPEVLEAMAVLFGKHAEKELPDFGLDDTQIKRLLEIKKKISDPKLFKVMLHEGKAPSEYDYIEWRDKLTEDQKKKISDTDIPDDATGEDAYKLLTKKLGSPEKASQYLLSKGIDGITYKSHKGTGGYDGEGKNYVVFDEKATKIEAVNGEAPKQEVHYTDKNGNQVITGDDGLKNVVNKKGEPVSAPTKRRVINEHMADFDFSAGERAPEPTNPIENEADAMQHIAETSSNPAELAEAYDKNHESEKLNDVEAAIANHGIGKVTGSSYNRFGDRNNMNNSKARSYVAKDGQEIDSLAKTISDHSGVEVSPEDIVAFMDRFPNGQDVLKERPNETGKKAAARFQEITGFKLDSKTSEIARMQEPTALTPEEITIADTKISPDIAEQIIKDEGLTKETLEQNKHLFDGFPYTKEDYEAVKILLHGEEGGNTTESADAGQESPGNVDDKKTGIPGEETPEDTGTKPEKREKGNSSGQNPHEVTPEEIKQLQSVHDKAVADLKAATEKLAAEQGKQADMFAGGQQKGMFEADPNEAKNILDPLKTKVKEAKEALDQAKIDLENQDKRKQPDLFEQKIDEAADKLINFLTPKTMKGDDRINANGLTVDQIVKGAAEAIKIAYRAGKDIKDAIEEAIDYVKKNWDPKWGVLPEDKLRDLFEKGMEEKLKEDADLKNLTREQVADILKKNASNKTFLNAIKNSGIVQAMKKIWTGTVRAFHPFLLDGKEQGRDAAMIIRKNTGTEAHENVVADKDSEDALSFWNKRKRVDNVAFMLSMENPDSFGGIHGDQRALALEYRNRMDRVFDMISKIKDVNFIDDYFPHFWKTPDKARATLPNLGKNPLEGNKSFLKQRFYSNIMEGLKSGLDLATYNPEEMVRLAEQNALHFKTANDIFTDLKQKGLLKYFQGKPDEGWVKINDPMFNKKAAITLPEGGAKPIEGGYYARDAVASVLNNFTDKGLFKRGGAVGTITKSIRYYNNLKNQVQLGLGLFHFSTTTIDATVTGWGNALKLLTTGKPALMAKGAFDLVKSATILPNLISVFSKGYKANKLYKEGAAAQEVNDLVTAGARVKMQKIYAIDAAYNMKKAWQNFTADHKPADLGKAAWNGLWVLPEKLVGHYLMDVWVPALKTGGYLKTLETELAANSNMTERETQKIKNRIWDSMDNRLGIVTYDNVFWDKTIKDLGFMGIRSLGWTGGTVKAFGTGVADIPKSLKNVVQGKGIEHTTGWMVSLPLAVGLYGALYQYMMTGKGPQELKDYFFPKDGTKDADGNDNRVSMPTYMKDVYAYAKDPLQTAQHKLAPFMNEMTDMMNNKDFYGVRIYNPEDNLFQKGLDILKYQAQTMVPFSFKQNPTETKGFFESVATKEGAEKVMGIMPAGKNFERTDIQNEISKEASSNFSDEAKTKEQADLFAARHEVKKALRTGTPYSEIPQELKDRAKYSGKSLSGVIKDSKKDYYAVEFKHLKPEQQLKVWGKMSDEEKKLYGKFAHKTGSFSKLFNERDELIKNHPEYKKFQEEMSTIKTSSGDNSDDDQ